MKHLLKSASRNPEYVNRPSWCTAARVPNTYLQHAISWILGILANRRTNKLRVIKWLWQNDSHSPPPPLYTKSSRREFDIR